MQKTNPRIPFFLNYSMFFLLALALVIARCKKEENQGNPPGNGAGNLSIQFNTSSIPLGMIDSAVVILSKGAATAKKTFDKNNDRLSVSLAGLDAGNWSATIYIYSRIANDNYPRRYDLIKTFTLAAESGNLEYAAPTGQLQGDWKTRVILAEADQSLVLIVALDPADHYYDIKVRSAKWDYVYIDRTAAFRQPDGTAATDGASWECADECFQNGELNFDRNVFTAYSQRIASKNWYRAETYCFFMNSGSTEERTFYYSYNK